MIAMLFFCDRRIAAAAMILCCILWTATGLALGMSRVHAKTPSDVSQAIWIDEDESGQQGHRSVGSVVWRTTVFSGTPEPSTPVVTGIDPREAVPLAEIEVPDRGVSATWLLRCITDPTFSIPASHLIEIKFKLPKDLADIGIQMIRGVGAKQTAQSPASILSGLVVSVGDTWMLALMAKRTDIVRNVRFLKEAKWFETRLYYNSHSGGATLLIEKGASGDRVFAEAFRVWGNRSCTSLTGHGTYRR
jgi:hypothetical protein